MTTNRPCADCGKPLSAKRKRMKRCYSCECAAKRRQKQEAHDRAVEKKYGLLPGDYQRMYDAQGGRCAIHGCRARGIKIALAVEHNHKLGLTRLAVRGLVCKTHNKWIGMAGDDPEVFDSLADYLRNPPARKVLI